MATLSKPHRKAALVRSPDHALPVLRLTVSGKVTDYLLTLNDWGEFYLEKEDGPESYEGELPDGPIPGHCTCPAHQYRYAKDGPCKHVAALEALRRAGKLPTD